MPVTLDRSSVTQPVGATPMPQHDLDGSAIAAMPDDYLLCIGIMTGNSLDSADAVLTAFYPDGRIQDLCSHPHPFEPDLSQAIRALKQFTVEQHGDMGVVAESFACQIADRTLNFQHVHDWYMTVVIQTVNELVAKARTDHRLSQYNLDAIDVIGFHGQTCDHYPPSRRSDETRGTYTVQIGDGQTLANETGITVVYDFRSDDIFHGGEGAPLAPIHNQHLASHMRAAQGPYPMTFCNAGNTGNLTHVTHRVDAPTRLVTMGWDTGPFNHYPDLLMQTIGEPCDRNGQWGQQGSINLDVLAALFERAVTLETGENFLLQPPPHSGDPNFYRWIPELDDPQIAFEDRLRTAEYFSAYVFVYSLSLTPEDLIIPTYYSNFGGGWKNPVILADFEHLLCENCNSQPILDNHRPNFERLWQRLRETGKPIIVESSDTLGIDSQFMEARIFADMARCRLLGKPFSTPETTGVQQPVVGGIIRYPQQDPNRASQRVKAYLAHYSSQQEPRDYPEYFDSRWSRAAAGWPQMLSYVDEIGEKIDVAASQLEQGEGVAGSVAIAQLRERLHTRREDS